MAYPVLQFNNVILNAISMTSTQSGTQDISNSLAFSVQTTWTGTSPVGTLVISGSLDNQTWTPISSQAINANSGNFLFNADHQAYIAVQVSYVYTSGTGTLTSRISSKQNGY